MLHQGQWQNNKSNSNQVHKSAASKHGRTKQHVVPNREYMQVWILNQLDSLCLEDFASLAEAADAKQQRSPVKRFPRFGPPNGRLKVRPSAP